MLRCASLSCAFWATGPTKSTCIREIGHGTTKGHGGSTGTTSFCPNQATTPSIPLLRMSCKIRRQVLLQKKGRMVQITTPATVELDDCSQLNAGEHCCDTKKQYCLVCQGRCRRRGIGILNARVNSFAWKRFLEPQRLGFYCRRQSHRCSLC